MEDLFAEDVNVDEDPNSARKARKEATEDVDEEMDDDRVEGVRGV